MSREVIHVTTEQSQPTVDEFLKRPEQKPFLEFIHGEVRAKAMPDEYHSITQVELSTALNNWSRHPRIGRTMTEQRCLLKVANETEVVLPDVAWWSIEQRPVVLGGAISTAPTLAVEIVSPEDRYGDVQDKIQIYLSAGVRVVWVIDPRTRSVTLCRPGQPQEILKPPAALSDDALPGFEFALDDLFSALDVADSAPRIQE